MNTHEQIIAILVKRLGGRATISMRDLQDARGLVLLRGPERHSDAIEFTVTDPHAPIEVEVRDVTPGRNRPLRGLLEDRR